jgi:hypothetical protein
MDAEISLTDRRAGLARLGRFAGALRAVFGRLVDVAIPYLCASCREPISTEGLCAVCWSKLSFIAPPYCERLGIPFPYDPGPGVISIEAITDPPAYRRARAAVRYGDVASNARPRLEIRRPPRPGAVDGALDGQCRPRPPG